MSTQRMSRPQQKWSGASRGLWGIPSASDLVDSSKSLYRILSTLFVVFSQLPVAAAVAWAQAAHSPLAHTLSICQQHTLPVASCVKWAAAATCRTDSAQWGTCQNHHNHHLFI